MEFREMLDNAHKAAIADEITEARMWVRRAADAGCQAAKDFLSLNDNDPLSNRAHNFMRIIVGIGAAVAAIGLVGVVVQMAMVEPWHRDMGGYVGAFLIGGFFALLFYFGAISENRKAAAAYRASDRNITIELLGTAATVSMRGGTETRTID